MTSSLPDAQSWVSWPILIATVVGGLISFSSSFLAKVAEERRQAKALRAAFHAEIAALVKIAEKRGHVRVAQSWIAAWKSGVDHKPVFHGAPTERDPVFSKNVDKIGMLGRDAGDVVAFYTLLEAVRVQLRYIEAGNLNDKLLHERAVYVEQALSVWAEALNIAGNLNIRLTR